MCSELGFQRIQFEGDASKVVDAVNKGEYNGSSWGQLVSDILSGLGAFLSTGR